MDDLLTKLEAQFNERICPECFAPLQGRDRVKKHIRDCILISAGVVAERARVQEPEASAKANTPRGFPGDVARTRRVWGRSEDSTSPEANVPPKQRTRCASCNGLRHMYPDCVACNGTGYVT